MEMEKRKHLRETEVKMTCVWRLAVDGGAEKNSRFLPTGKESTKVKLGFGHHLRSL